MPSVPRPQLSSWEGGVEALEKPRILSCGQISLDPGDRKEALPVGSSARVA